MAPSEYGASRTQSNTTPNLAKPFRDLPGPS